jgi:hypothetical protein
MKRFSLSQIIDTTIENQLNHLKKESVMVVTTAAAAAIITTITTTIITSTTTTTTTIAIAENSKQNLINFYKENFNDSRVGQITTYSVVGKRNYSQINNLVEKN